MDDSRNARIAAAVWPRPGHENAAACAKKRARRNKSLLQAVVMLAIGLVFFLAAKQPVIGAVAVVLSALVFLCGRFFFPVYDRMDGFVAATARLVGVILTWLLLVPFFGLIFVPARVIIVLSRKDPLCRRFRTEHKTFWVPHPDRIPGSFERQY